MKFIILLILPLQLFAQKYKTTTEPYKAINGKTYEKGATIITGTPYNFTNIYCYFFKDYKRQKPVEAVVEFTYSGASTTLDFRLNKFNIKKFLLPENGRTYAVVGGIIEYVIDIDSALITGELISTEQEKFMLDKTPVLTDSLAYLEYLKFTHEYTTENAKEFMYLFNKQKYNKIREDEFEFNKEINKTKNFLKSETTVQDSLKVYRVLFEDVFGNYDFEKKSFPILWENNGLHLLSDIWILSTPEDINKNQISLTDLKLSFSNIHQFNLMPLNEEKANNLVKFRKEADGNINRKIFMVIYFTIKSLDMSKAGSYKLFSTNGENNFQCKIQSIFFCEDNFPSRNVISYTGNIK